MIYTRFHDPITILREATPEDFQALIGRKPFKPERQRMTKEHMLWVVRYATDSAGAENKGQEALLDVADMRADLGLGEIFDTLGKAAPHLADYFK